MNAIFKAASGVAAMAAASMAMADPIAANAACELTGLQKAAGYVNFSNIVMFICAVGGALFTGILMMHLRGLFKMIPLALYKAAGYAGVVALCASGSWMGAQNAPYGQFLGAALGAGALAVLLGDLADLFGWEKKGQTVWHASVMVLGGSLALTQANPMVGGVAVLGLMGLLGFSAFSAPGMVAMGFDSKDGLWKATFAALAVLIPSALYRIHFGTMHSLEMFWPAIGWICSLVASIGLLIASSRFYGGKGGAFGYMARNALMVGFALFCLWAGSVHGFVEMQRIAGTFLVVWLFEKPWDIPKAGIVGYSLVGAISCGAVFMLMQEVAANPDRWAKFLLF